jgi:hypothetical protein
MQWIEEKNGCRIVWEPPEPVRMDCSPEELYALTQEREQAKAMRSLQDAHVWAYVRACGVERLENAGAPHNPPSFIPSRRRTDEEISAHDAKKQRSRELARFKASLHDAHVRAPRRWLESKFVQREKQEAHLKTLCAAASIWLSPRAEEWERP